MATTTTLPSTRNDQEKQLLAVRQEIEGGMLSLKNRIVEVLPKHVDFDRFKRSILVSVHETPALANCTVDSILIAAMHAAMWGLEVDTPLQLCHMIPFKGKAKLIIGYRGLIQLCDNTGELEVATARIVYEKEPFRVTFGIQPDIQHEYYLGPDRGQIRAGYAVIKLKSRSQSHIEVMSRDDLDEVKRTSPSATDPKSPWITSYGEMCRKTVLKRGFKYVPLSPSMRRLAEALTIDGRYEAGEDVTVDGLGLDPNKQIKNESRSGKLASEIKAKPVSGAPAPEPEPENPSGGEQPTDVPIPGDEPIEVQVETVKHGSQQAAQEGGQQEVGEKPMSDAAKRAAARTELVAASAKELNERLRQMVKRFPNQTAYIALVTRLVRAGELSGGDWARWTKSDYATVLVEGEAELAKL